MRDDSTITGEYMEIDGEDFSEWVHGAPVWRLCDALREFLIVMESECKLVDKNDDFTDPEIFTELRSAAYSFCWLGPWIMEIRDELSDRLTPDARQARACGNHDNEEPDGQ